MQAEAAIFRIRTFTGDEWSFVHSYADLKRLGTVQEVVDLYVGLFGPRAADEARYALACLCEQDAPLQLLGWLDMNRVSQPGTFSQEEQIVLARILLQLGFIDAGDSLADVADLSAMATIEFPETVPQAGPTWKAYMAHLKEITNV